MPRPVRVAIVNDYEIVVAGIASLLAPYVDRIDVVELDARLPVASRVDVILFDTFGHVRGEGVDLEDLARSGVSRVAIFSWDTEPALVRRMIARGASAYLSKALTADQLVDVLERVHRGERVVPEADAPVEHAGGRWPGHEEGLSLREAEVISLITQGESNHEIAAELFLSINSVKTYIRAAYRKMGVTRRSQAVVWGVQLGFDPDRSRVVRTGAP